MNAVDTLYVSVTICQHGSTINCQTIPYVQVDTQSYGLRIIGAGVLSSTLYAELTPETGTNNAQLAECAQWADGFSWGPMVTADIQIAGTGGGEAASDVPVQIIGASNYPATVNEAQGTDGNTLPATCTDTGASGLEDTVATFGANGIIGVGAFVQDCGDGCAGSGTPEPGAYYVCPTTTTCTAANVPVAQQTSNPVAYFTTDNNGVIIELPAIPAAGQSVVNGSLVFGINTETNNQLGSATVLPASPNYGTITTTFNGTALDGSYFDTGSNGLFFNDSSDTSLTQCTSTDYSGFYCPASTLSFSATVEGCTSASAASFACSAASTPTVNVDFSVANASTLDANGTFAAFNDLGGTVPAQPSGSPFNGTFDWGLPFFFGQNVFVAIACGADDSGVSNCVNADAPFYGLIAN
ncbi:MAG TPA: DUF3443 family protein [Steroidobacteraceae bacterium]|nr:DUF3443 family protein [Steroidobacteraceae bacterium]